jgi:ATP-dependent Clp protease ATP-binding subunit ClpA
VFEKFSAQAIQALNAAREEALRLEFSQVNAEHLLLGISHERRGVAARCLQRRGIEQKHLRLAVEHLAGRGYSLIRAEDLIFSPEVLRALARAAKSNATPVESHHLFQALLAEHDGAACAVLKHLRIEIEALSREAYALAREDVSTGISPLEAPELPVHFTPRLLTPEALEALARAFETARAQGHTLVGTEQVLTGLLEASAGLAPRVLSTVGASVLAVAAVAYGALGHGSGAATYRRGFSLRVREALERSWIEAKRHGHTRIGTGHILWGLLEAEAGGALYILDRLELDLVLVRDELERAFAAAPGDPEPPMAPEDAEFGIEVLQEDVAFTRSAE